MNDTDPTQGLENVPCASLPMYARPELDAAHGVLWALIRDRLRAFGVTAPDALNQGAGTGLWRTPSLVLSQTCGYPYRTALRDHVQLVGTPDYALPDCPQGHYFSVLVTRRGSGLDQLSDLDGARLAYNSDDSQSGYHGPLAHVTAAGVALRQGPATGAHWHSVRAVHEGRADVAGIDAVTWHHMQRFDAFTSDLQIIARTRPVPGLPLICAQGIDVAAVADAVRHAIDALDPDSRKLLRLRALMPFRPRDYTSAAFT